MQRISSQDIRAALKQVGLTRGQVVYLQSNLSTPGLVVGCKDKQQFCQAYLDAIFEIIGSQGTLVVPTYSTQVARFDIDFEWEKTPSLMGIFSEFIRTHPQSLRSLHPLHSLCALGAEQEFICRNNGTNNFGWNSPFHRLLLKKARILSIGLESGYAVGIAHVIEAFCDLPFVYNKLLKWSPIVKGVRDPRTYSATLRYLDLDVEYDLTFWVKHMRKLGSVSSARLGSSWAHCSDFAAVFEEGCKLSIDNPHFFLKRTPQYTYGRIPFDGPTAQRDDVARKEDMEKLSKMNWSGYYFQNAAYAGGDEDELS